MIKRGARWVGVLAALSLMVGTSWADDCQGSNATVHALQWKFGPGGEQHTLGQVRTPFGAALFPRDRPWGQNEYLIIGAGVVVTVLVIVLATADHHHDDPPHP